MSPEVILALSTLITSTGGVIVAVIAARRAGRAGDVASVARDVATDVRDEVKTMNELTLGQLGEATETRRIDAIPTEERTPRETRHVAMTEDDVPRPPAGRHERD